MPPNSRITAKTPAEFARQAGRFPTILEKATRAGVESMAREVKKDVEGQLRRAGIPSGGRLRGVGRRGARVGSRYDVTGFQNPTALVRMFGPAHLIEGPTRPHQIPRASRISRGRRRGQRRYVVIPGVGVRSRAMHPGTRGKYPWKFGVAKAKPKLPTIQMKFYVDSVKKTFGL